MLDVTKAVTYDWIPENLKAIESLRMRRASELMTQGMTRGRAMITASDQIAVEVMRPPKSGQELDKWIGQQQYALRVKAEPVMQYPESSNGRVHFDVPDGLTPPIATRRNQAQVMWGEAFKFIEVMPRDTWRPLRFDDPRYVLRASSSLSTHCVRVLKCKDHGWKFSSKRDKQHPNVLWVIKVTLK